MAATSASVSLVESTLVCQLKLYWMTGVWPRGAQVRSTVGRSETPDSSMKTMVCPRRAAFF
jgi:hypothetical protein